MITNGWMYKDIRNNGYTNIFMLLTQENHELKISTVATWQTHRILPDPPSNSCGAGSTSPASASRTLTVTILLILVILVLAGRLLFNDLQQWTLCCTLYTSQSSRSSRAIVGGDSWWFPCENQIENQISSNIVHENWTKPSSWARHSPSSLIRSDPRPSSLMIRFTFGYHWITCGQWTPVTNTTQNWL